MSQPLAATSSLPDVTEGIIFPPSDLYSDEPPLESDRHREQIELNQINLYQNTIFPNQPNLPVGKCCYEPNNF